MIFIDKIPVTGRRVILLGMDAVAVTFSLMVATWVRYPNMMLQDQFWLYVGVLPFVIIAKLGIFYVFRLYHFLWRYASLKEVFVVVKASLLGSLFLAAIAHFFSISHFGPRLITSDAVFTMVFIGGIRIILKSIREYLIRNYRGSKPLETLSRTLIIGAGDAGELVVRELLKKHVDVVGFVDDEVKKTGIRIHNIPVLGTTAQLPELVAKYAVESAIIAVPSATGKTVRRLMSLCQTSGISFKITPNLLDLVLKKESIDSVRNVSIEDLLGRDVVSSDMDTMASYLRDQVVLITGAGGSIGSELCRQIAMCQPKLLLLLDQAETALFQIDGDIAAAYPSVARKAIVTDVRHDKRLRHVFEAHQPTVIFHAAAYKHVPLMEAHAHEAFENNILGTRNIMALAAEFQSREFVLISTDKAVRPTNCMGATKRICEMLMQYYAELSDNKTTFTAVRFGNVLGSQGSVIPIFKKQIEMGGPITITHPEMTRYFMTIPEAVSLVIQAGSLSRGGEIFILDMGEPVKIVNLAKDLVELSGLVFDKDIHVVFTGLRPGEKLYEELSFNPDLLQRTAHPQIFVTRDVPPSLSSIVEGVLSLDIGGMAPVILRDELVAIANQSSPSVS
jgi:FlaA1/EpsC-like NDP-sugar epimerase